MHGDLPQQIWAKTKGRTRRNLAIGLIVIVVGAADKTGVAYNCFYGRIELGAIALVLRLQIHQRNFIATIGNFRPHGLAHDIRPSRLWRSPKPIVTGRPVAIDS